MKFCRLLPLLTLLALIVAPFGRVAAAEAMTMAHPPATAMAGHCDDMPATDEGDRTDKSRIDCLVACAAVAAAEPLVLAARLAAAVLHNRAVPPQFAGLHPEAEPPPPRLS